MQSNLNFGLFKTDFIYQDKSNLQTSSSLKTLIREKPTWQWNFDFISLYRQGKDTWPMTPVQGIEKISNITWPHPHISSSFLNLLDLHFNRMTCHSINLAISGGLDSQVLALYARDKGFHVNAYYLQTNIDGYCESQQVQKFCNYHSIEYIQIETDYLEFIQSLPSFLEKVECPIYNLHPVSKWILAREISKLGVTQIYSGDGADQSFAGSEFCDLFFLTKQCFEHFNVELITPLANWPLLLWANENGPFLNKEPLRNWAHLKWQIGSEKKKPSYFPDKRFGFDSYNQSLDILRRSLCAP
tara:strand:- start:62942 stop:63841 length:900 start_codon:yes stop_codon:yes gene_type:complete